MSRAGRSAPGWTWLPNDPIDCLQWLSVSDNPSPVAGSAPDRIDNGASVARVLPHPAGRLAVATLQTKAGLSRQAEIDTAFRVASNVYIVGAALAPEQAVPHRGPSAPTRVGASVDTELPRVGTALADRSGHRPHIGRRQAGLEDHVSTPRSAMSHGHITANRGGAPSGAAARPGTIGADDGIRTRDPHLGKVTKRVRCVLMGPVSCEFVRSESVASVSYVPVVERSTTYLGRCRR